MNLDILNSARELMARKSARHSLQELLDTYALEYAKDRKESYKGEPTLETPTDREFIKSGKEAAKEFYNEVIEHFAAIDPDEVRELYDESASLGITKEVFILLLRLQIWNDFERNVSNGNVGDELQISWYTGNETAYEIIEQLFEKRMEEIARELMEN